MCPNYLPYPLRSIYLRVRPPLYRKLITLLAMLIITRIAPRGELDLHASLLSMCWALAELRVWPWRLLLGPGNARGQRELL